MTVMLLISHEVNDFAAWKPGFDGHAEARKGAGFVDMFVGQDAGNPNLVHAGFEVPSVEAAQAFLANPDLKDAMEKGGVISEPVVRIVLVG